YEYAAALRLNPVALHSISTRNPCTFPLNSLDFLPTISMEFFMSTQGYLALDLGAESGRAILATLDKGKVAIEELHRFRHLPVKLPSGLHWNLTELWAQMMQGVSKGAATAKERNIEIVSL